MSIETQINRIKTGVQSAYTELENKGATMPTTLNVDNLASTISNMPAGSTTQADWNVHDETDPAYVKNRPMYIGEPVENEIINDTFSPFMVEEAFGCIYLLSQNYPDVISPGQNAKVILDGSEYYFTFQLYQVPGIELPYVYVGNAAIIDLVDGSTGGEDTGEPFVIMYMDHMIAMYTTTPDITEHTLSIAITEISVTVSSGYEIALQSDWNENDVNSSNYVKNRPFYTYYENTELVNGSTLGKLEIMPIDDTTMLYMAFLEQSIVAAEECSNFVVNIDETEYVITSPIIVGLGNTYLYFLYEGGVEQAEPFKVYDTGEPFLFIPDDDGLALLTTLPGETHNVVITADVPQHVKMDTKYLPDYSETFLTKSYPTGTGALSMNRKSDTAVGGYSVALGYNTTASGYGSHAEGQNTTASGNSSHAEGSMSTASGYNSHTEGYYTTASGEGAHAEGYYTKASSQYQHVQGKYNIEDTNNTYAHIVGNGTSDSARSNAHTLDWNGNAWFKGDVYVGGNSQTDGTPIGQLAKKAVHAGISANSNALNTSFMENYLKVANGEAVLDQFIHLSDKVLTMSDLEKGFVISMSEPLEDVDGFASGALVDVMEMPPKAMNEELFTTMVEEMNGMIAIAGACFVVPTDNFTLEGITFPKKGIWAPFYVTSLLVHGYNFNDGAGDLLVEIEDVINLGDTLTWDGNTAGRDIIGDPSMGWIKISDQVITVADCANGGTITLSTGEVNEFTANDIREDTTGFSIGYAVAYFNIPANANVNASSGIYFLAGDDGGYVASIKINGFNFTTSSTRQEINQKYLPEHLQFGESGGSDTITWNGNTDGRESYANVGFKVSDVVLTSNDCANGGTFIINYAEGDLKTETINFTSADVESNGDALMIRNGTILALGEISAKDFNVSPGTYFMKDDVNISFGGVSLGVTTYAWIASLKINGYAGFGKTFKPIDPKYLPESLQFGEEKPELYGSATVVNGALTWDGNTSGLVSMGNALYLLSDNVSCIELVRKYDNGDEYITVTVEYYNIAAGSTSSVAGKLDSDSGNDALWALNTNSPDVDLDLGVVIAMEDNMTYGPPEMGFTFPKKGLYFLSNSEYRVISLTIDGYDFGAGKITPIDEKLLPEMSSFILKSSTPGSTKKFKITVDDSGTLTATEITS